jgi:hypothetical protein
VAEENVVEGELWIVVVRSEASRRKRAVFCRAGRRVVGFVEARKVVSQVVLGGRALVVKWVERWVARSGFGVVVVVVVVVDDGAGAGGWRWLAICLLFSGVSAIPQYLVWESSGKRCEFCRE